MTQKSSEPTSPAKTGRGASIASSETGGRPSLPHETDEASHSQARASQDQKEVGEKAFKNATDGTIDTDKGPEMDKLYNGGKVAPDRGAKTPRR